MLRSPTTPSGQSVRTWLAAGKTGRSATPRVAGLRALTAAPRTLLQAGSCATVSQARALHVVVENQPRSVSPDGDKALGPGETGRLAAGPTAATAWMIPRGVSVALRPLIGWRATGTFGLAFKADALWVGTTIGGVDGPAGRLKETGAAVTRFRTALEGSRRYVLMGRLSLKPSMEVGLRHDSGDAEEGSSVDGGGIVVFDPVSGLSAEVRVRMLLVHEAEGFSDRGVSVSVSYSPTPSTPLGFTARGGTLVGRAGDERGAGAMERRADRASRGLRRARAGRAARRRRRLRASGGPPLRRNAPGRLRGLRVQPGLPGRIQLG